MPTTRRTPSKNAKRVHVAAKETTQRHDQNMTATADALQRIREKEVQGKSLFTRVYYPVHSFFLLTGHSFLTRPERFAFDIILTAMILVTMSGLYLYVTSLLEWLNWD
eukprot:TRINITY_DN8712_c0_g1_i1.p1 TRINITY_DN8712_c0_g1~~TRINITY_DN8712_c0_g1_i1.p1  ORF type:complete len:108 (-),score=12.77 TRINITY_DN8712_c0_g1_i1:155-478(-)